MGVQSKAKQEALGKKYIGKHGVNKAPARGKKERVARMSKKK